MAAPVLLGHGVSSGVGVGSAVPVGGLVVVYVGCTAGGTHVISAASDNRGNSYPVVAGGTYGAICASNIATALAPGDSISVPVGGVGAVAVVYFPDGSSNAAATAYDANTSINAGAYSLSTSGSVNANDIVAFAAAGDDLDDSVPITSGWTTLVRYRADVDSVIYACWLSPSSAGVQTATVGWPPISGNPAVGAIVAFGAGRKRGLTMLV